MAPIDERHAVGLRRSLLRLLLPFVAVILLAGVLMVSLDNICYGAMSQKIPVYPNAQITLQEHNLFRQYGLGQTVIILDSADDVTIVRDWYGRTTSAAMRAAQDRGDRTYSWASARWSVTTAEDGSGSQIILNGNCGQ
jgi:hypothetical protein